MKYQVRIRDTMSDRPARKLCSTLEQAQDELAAVRKEIRETWAVPDVDAAYIMAYFGEIEDDKKTKKGEGNVRTVCNTNQ